MRVAVGARTCSLICPASTLGKKSSPSQGYKAKEAAQTAKKPSGKITRCARHLCRIPRYPFRNLSNCNSKCPCKRTNGFRLCNDFSADSSLCAFSRYRAIVGTRGRELREEARL